MAGLASAFESANKESQKNKKYGKVYPAQSAQAGDPIPLRAGAALFPVDNANRCSKILRQPDGYTTYPVIRALAWGDVGVGCEFYLSFAMPDDAPNAGWGVTIHSETAAGETGQCTYTVACSVNTPGTAMTQSPWPYSSTVNTTVTHATAARRKSFSNTAFTMVDANTDLHCTGTTCRNNEGICRVRAWTGSTVACDFVGMELTYP